MAEAEPLLNRALSIFEQVLGPQHPEVATTLNNLGWLYRAQGRLAEAEPLFKYALAISEQALGLEHPEVATTLNNLALLYHAQGRLAEAEPLYQRAFAIQENVLGNAHPKTAETLNNLTLLYHAQGRLAEAKPRETRLRSKIVFLIRKAAEETNLAQLDQTLAGLPKGKKGFLAEALHIREMVNKICQYQRRLDTISRPFFRELQVDLLCHEVELFRHRVSSFQEPLASEFRKAADHWFEIAYKQ